MNEQLGNLSFLVLLSSMICYWIGPLSRDLVATESPKNSATMSQPRYAGIPNNREARSRPGFTKESTISYNTYNIGQPNTFMGKLMNNIRSQIGSFKLYFNISNSLQLIGRTGIILANILLMLLLCNRWKESGHFPLSNLYESLMFLSWSFTVIHLFIENLTNSQTTSNSLENKVFVTGNSVSQFIGAITTPSALFTNAFASFTLPKEMQGSSSLVPALQSNWLMMHVTVMIISYAALILGSLLSIAYLIITVQRKSNTNLSTTLDSNNRKGIKPGGTLTSGAGSDLFCSASPPPIGWSSEGSRNWRTPITSAEFADVASPIYGDSPTYGADPNHARGFVLQTNPTNSATSADAAHTAEGRPGDKSEPVMGSRQYSPPHIYGGENLSTENISHAYESSSPFLEENSIEFSSRKLEYFPPEGGKNSTLVDYEVMPTSSLLTISQSGGSTPLESVALTLDNLSYRILGIGFPFLTIGILSGAVWANEAWGSYWSWDPKETWAFLTWLVYAIYLHTRLNKGWEGKKPAIIASLGFIVTWVCYLGVNLIGEGLHSYGWIPK
jgi:ABC-type transport system involved in cytochrome c biogenesis permease subunit